jgi:3,4-dihydroxy 2-butanone 4-phosphate synthase / GTP cyclohydrolase II
LARLAGLPPAGVICEIMNPDGTMARRPELLKFARKHGLVLLSVADLIRYRLQREGLVRRLSSRQIHRPDAGELSAYSYVSDVDATVHVALVKGDIGGPAPVLTRVHRACIVGDLLGCRECGCSGQLSASLDRIAKEGRGVLLYLRKQDVPGAVLECTHVAPEEPAGRASDHRLREFGLGAQILKDLGLSRLRLLTSSPKKIVGLESYGLKVVEQIPLTPPVLAPTRLSARARRVRKA